MLTVCDMAKPTRVESARLTFGTEPHQYCALIVDRCGRNWLAVVMISGIHQSLACSRIHAPCTHRVFTQPEIESLQLDAVGPGDTNEAPTGFYGRRR